MYGRAVVVGTLVLTATAGLDTVYRAGEWSFGPASPAARRDCADIGGREGDLFLIHHCAPDPFRDSATP